MYKITSLFHQQESFRLKPHSGIDFKMNVGEPIRSIKDGVIRIADYGHSNAGKTVFVKWDNGQTAIYGHLNDFAVTNGQHVHAGDLLGHAGNTGFSTGSHLHFGLKEGSKFIDPSPYINDIQHMNDTNYFVSNHITDHAPEVTQLKINFFDYMQQHMNVVHDSLSSLKLHLISSLTNDVFFVKIFEQLFQFVSAHSCLLDFIVTHIV